MKAQEYYDKLIETKNNMFITSGQSGILKPEYTREQAKEIYSKIEATKNALMANYSFQKQSVADYIIDFVDNKGYNKPVKKGRFVFLYKSSNEYIQICDKTGMDFAKSYLNME